MSSKRPRRWLRSLIVTVVILAGLGIAADRLAESLAEKQLATIAQNEAARYDVRASDTSAEVGGFGFLPQLAKGEFSRITLIMDQPTISAVPAQDLTVAMTGVHVPREVLTGDTGAAVTVDTADVRLRLSPDALTKVARTNGLDGLKLRIVGGKLQAQITVQGVEASATVRPQAQNGRISLVLDNLPPAVRDAVNSLLSQGIELPKLPFGATLKQIAVKGQLVVLTATAADLSLRR
jgi:hypothetical protein